MAGRPKAYDRDHILIIARELFWQKGYAGASLLDLTKEMEVSKSTFYNAFESKDELYKICLENYGREFVREMIQKVAVKDWVLPSLRKYFENIATENEGDTPARGCLLVNSANEIGLTHPFLSPVIQDLMQLVCNTLKNALDLAVRKGELKLGFDTERGAIYLLTMMNGLRTMVKSGTDPDILKKQVDLTFDKVILHW
ncbi:MAG: TetR/AcrR family transcriptional regulator [Opitutales bacterium]|nr:TetR/AcrR family transcriptional regulator [Opitutales bacterium]